MKSLMVRGHPELATVGRRLKPRQSAPESPRLPDALNSLPVLWRESVEQREGFQDVPCTRQTGASAPCAFILLGFRVSFFPVPGRWSPESFPSLFFTPKG